MKNILFHSGKHKPLASFALLILRVSSGLLMITHGYPKLLSLIDNPSAFPDPVHIGPALSHGLTVFAEFFCAILIVIGLATRWAAIPLMIAMAVAAFVIHAGDAIGKKEMALLYLSVYSSILMLGAGNYSLDKAISGK